MRILTLIALSLSLFGCMRHSERESQSKVEDRCRSISPNPNSVREFYEDNPTYSAPNVAQETWPSGTPESQKMKSEVLQEGAQELKRLPQPLSLLVQRNGVLVFEKYFHKSKVTHANNIHSASKSILSALVGIALREKFLTGLDQPISEILEPKFTFTAEKRKLTLRHLLTMTAGLEWTEDATEYDVETTPNWVQSIIDLPLKHEPGTAFNYNTGLTHLLSAILTESSGTSTCAFAHKYLFNDLGVAPQHWGRDPQGYFSGGYSVYLTPRELMKFGSLYLQNGVANGKSLVPTEWINDSLRPHVEPTDQLNPSYAYGLLWWLPPQLPDHAVHKMWGFGGQYVYVVPALDLVAVITSDTSRDYKEMDGDAFFSKYVLSAISAY